jgi:hypothetical protein
MKQMKLILLICAAQVSLLSDGYAQPKISDAGVTMPGPQLGVAWGFTYGYNNKAEIFLPQLRNLGVHLTKLYLFWQQVEPVKGQYQWNAVDTFVNQLTSSEEALISVSSASAWATKISSPMLPFSPAKSPDEYYKFVFDLVKHCKGKIKLWQNDSEPNNPVYWNGTADDFIGQLKIFYRAVKDADPAAQVVMGGYDGLFNPPGMPEIPGQQYGLSFFRKAIKEASAYFDIFDIRLYANPYTIPARVEYFKKQLADSGRHQPIICTEYNGPGFFGFPVNFKYIGQVTEWQRVIAARDTAAYLKMGNPIAKMYDSINSLAPETQMFMMGSSKELNDKYDRLQCRDIVMRNILAFSAGVQKTMYWDLWHDTNEKNDLMTLMFGKNKLLDYDNGRLSVEHPEATVFKRLAGYLNQIKSIKRIDVAGKPSLYFFELSGGGKTLYVAWEKRDVFSGEDQPATHYVLPWSANNAKATDIFGNTITATVSKDNVAIDISSTPAFIEMNK